MAHYVPSQGHAARFPAVNLYRLHRFLNPDCLPQKFHCLQRMDKLRVALDAPLGCGLGGDRGAELRHGARRISLQIAKISNIKVGPNICCGCGAQAPFLQEFVLVVKIC